MRKTLPMLIILVLNEGHLRRGFRAFDLELLVSNTILLRFSIESKMCEPLELPFLELDAASLKLSSLEVD